MYCPRCGSPNSDQNKFCAQCGAALPPTHKHRRMPVILIGIIGLIVIGLVVSVVILLNQGISPDEQQIFVAHADPELWEGRFLGYDKIYTMEDDQLILFDQADQGQLFARPMNILGTKSLYHSPDGSHYAFHICDSDSCNVRIYDWDGVQVAEHETGIEPDLINILTLVFGAYGFSPDGNYYAYTVFNENQDVSGTILISMDDEIIHRIPNSLFGSFSSDSKGIIVGNFVDEGQLYDIQYLDIQTGVTSSLSGGDSDFQLFSDILGPYVTDYDSYVYYPIEDGIYRADLESNSGGLFYDCEGNMCIPVYSPEVGRLFLFEYRDETHSLSVYMFDHSGKTHRLVGENLNTEVWDFGPFDILEDVVAFSPDGKHISYFEEAEDAVSLVIYNITEESTVELGQSDRYARYFSPDSQWIGYIEVNQERQSDINGDFYIIDVNGDHQQFIDNDVHSFKFSADSKSLLYVKLFETEAFEFTSEIYRINIDGTGRKRVTGPEDGIYYFFR